jgi:hypothetical protein
VEENLSHVITAVLRQAGHRQAARLTAAAGRKPTDCVVLLGLVEKVNINQTSDFRRMAGMNSL